MPRSERRAGLVQLGRLCRTDATERRVRDGIQSFFRDITAAAHADPVAATFNAGKGSMDCFHFRQAGLAKAFEDLIHLGFGCIIFPVRVRLLLKMSFNAMQASVEFCQPFAQDTLSFFKIFHDPFRFFQVNPNSVFYSSFHACDRDIDQTTEGLRDLELAAASLLALVGSRHVF